MIRFLYKVDNFGVREYRKFMMLLASLAIYAVSSYFAANYLLSVEITDPSSNIKTFRDAYWLCFVASSTVGFGEFYPVTDAGRLTIGLMFLMGATQIGILLGIISAIFLGFTDTGVKNRELRRQLDELAAHNKHLETHLKKIDKDNGVLYQHNDELFKHNEGLLKHNEEILQHNKTLDVKLDLILNAVTNHKGETT